MAQPGSVSGIAENALIVSGKKNECCMASARSNCFCASGVHDVLKSTPPSFSPRAFAPSSWADAAVVTKTSTRPRTSARILWWLMSCLRVWVKAAILADVGGVSHEQAQDVLAALGQRRHRGRSADRDAVSPAERAAPEVHAGRGGGLVRDPSLPLRPEGPLSALAADPHATDVPRLERALRRTPKLRRLLARLVR